MCTCGHGQDQHYLDYAGPGICGGVSGKCLEDGCPCRAYFLQTAVTIIPSTIYHPPHVFKNTR